MKALRSRLRRLYLAAMLSALLVFAVAGQALAWNGSTYVDDPQHCSGGQYCAAHIYIGGGTDSYDYIRVDFYTNGPGGAGTQHWEGGLNRGGYDIPFWVISGRYATGFTIWWYDSVYGPNCWVGPVA